MDAQAYHLAVEIDHAEMTFRGRVSIDLTGSGGDLKLDALDLTIKEVRSGGKALPFKVEAAKEALLISGVPAGPTTVDIEFSGVVPPRAFMGPYRSEYGDGHIFTTQFEATGCRRLFPCLDHPAQKAVFHVEVSAATGLKVIFNTPEKSSSVDGARTRHVFQPTPRMSTYLLYFGVGSFDETSRPSQKGYQIIVATPPGRTAEGTFALDRAAKMVDQFAIYFGNPYPLPKLHLIAVPNMGPGAMENWGAITFRERVLLVNDKTPVAVRKSVASVMAHEIAHQWFGNLVTMAWWNDIWLNESFATFAGTKVDDALAPEWDVWHDFMTTRFATAMLWDAVEHTHPIDAKVEDPEEIHQIFDDISYGKGASVLRMLEAFLGQEDFTGGVRAYLDAHRFGNAKGDDLWRALEAVAHQPVGRIMDAWIHRPGYPVIIVRRDGDRLLLHQRRFTLTGERKEAPWPVPLTLRAGGKVHRHLMDGESLELPLGRAPDLAFNVDTAGFYRVRLEGDLAKEARARFSQLTPLERWGGLNAQFAFALAGGAPISDYLDLVRTLTAETSPLVVREAVGHLNILFPLIEEFPFLVDPFRSLLKAQLKRLGPRSVRGEPENTTALRAQVLGGLVLIDPATRAELAAEYPDLDRAEGDRRSAILNAYAIQKGAEAFPELLARFRATTEDDQGSRIARAMGAIRDPVTLGKVLDLVLDPSVNPARGLEFLLGAVTLNPTVREPLWTWLVQNVSALAKGSQGTGLTSLLLQWVIPAASVGREEEAHRVLPSLEIPEGEAGINKGFDLLAVLSRLRSDLLASAPAAR